MHIYFIYNKFYELDGSSITIGGIQTYIQQLAKALVNAGHRCSVIQLSNTQDWETSMPNLSVKAYAPTKQLRTLAQKSRFLLDKIYSAQWDFDRDIVIWGTDKIAIKSNKIKAISIQHGIGFDGVWQHTLVSRIARTLGLQPLQKWQQRFNSVSSFLRTDTKVCVDYNYLNWIRTMVPRSRLGTIHVIPNSTEISQLPPATRPTTKLHILFARRFSEERGSLLMIEIAKQLLEKYPDIYFTLAGDGPYKELIQQELGDDARVHITKFTPNQSLEVHSQHHVALVPTCWSEGTSLSLLEAMTAGAVPIVSNVGGMTNIILDGYNGKMCNPDATEFVAAISQLYENESDRLRLQKNAQQSVEQAFSYNIWAKKWLNVIESV